NAFILHSAGSSHGIRNVGPEIARYLVFEFHASTAARSERRREIQLLEQLTEAQVRTDELTGERCALEAARVDLLEQLTAAHAQIDVQVREKIALEAALAGVWTSSSWRITAPLRGIARLLRRSR